MRLQLRSSLVKPAKKVIGKQRLTVLVNVSFPAPDLDLQMAMGVCESFPKRSFGSFFAFGVRSQLGVPWPAPFRPPTPRASAPARPQSHRGAAANAFCAFLCHPEYRPGAACERGH